MMLSQLTDGQLNKPLSFTIIVDREGCSCMVLHHTLRNKTACLSIFYRSHRIFQSGVKKAFCALLKQFTGCCILCGSLYC